MSADPASGSRRGPNKPSDPSAVADYLATMAANLARLARNNQLGALGYILEMAALEAENVANQSGARRKLNPADDAE